MKDLQWVWWGWLSWAFFYQQLDRRIDTMGHVYVWLLRIGPIELRKWQSRRTNGELSDRHPD